MSTTVEDLLVPGTDRMDLLFAFLEEANEDLYQVQLKRAEKEVEAAHLGRKIELLKQKIEWLRWKEKQDEHLKGT